MKNPEVIQTIQAILDASVWNVPSPDDEPEIVLTNWNVMQLPNRDRHFVGWNVAYRERRASTKIVAFDPATSRGKTVSGRIYELQGRTGSNADGMHTWRRWLKVNGVKEYVDVSAQTQAIIDSAQSKKEGL